MKTTTSDLSARADFQAYLDEQLPRGGLAVTFIEHGSRVEPTGEEVATGRLVCTEARRRPDGRWKYRIAIDPRDDPDQDAEALQLWIEAITPHHGMAGLWEAAAESTRGERCLLRFNAKPAPPWRPTPAMRAAVTEIYREVLSATDDTETDRSGSAS